MSNMLVLLEMIRHLSFPHLTFLEVTLLQSEQAPLEMTYKRTSPDG